MPRRNRPNPARRQLPDTSHEQGKTRYPTRADAERAIADIRRYQPDLVLHAYQSPADGGWYLTSR